MTYVVSPARSFDWWSPLRILLGLSLSLGILAGGFIMAGAIDRALAETPWARFGGLLGFLPFLILMFLALFIWHGFAVYRKNRRSIRYRLSADKLAVLVEGSSIEYPNHGVKLRHRRFWRNRFEVEVGGARLVLPSHVDLVTDGVELGAGVYGLAVVDERVVLKRWRQVGRGRLVETTLPF